MSGRVHRGTRALVLATLLCAVGESRGLMPQSPGGQVLPERPLESAQLTPERQQRTLQDAQRLLDLAQQLKVNVDKSTKDQLSMEVIREAEQIEKLAKQVKERTR